MMTDDFLIGLVCVVVCRDCCCFRGIQAEGVPYYMMRELAALKVCDLFLLLFMLEGILLTQFCSVLTSNSATQTSAR